MQSDVTSFIQKYQDNPVSFAENCLNFSPDEWQRAFLTEYANKTRKLSVKSGHGTGKSSVMCVMMLHHILFQFPQKTVVTAPSTSQLHSAIWADIKAMIDSLPPVLKDMLEYTAEKIVLKGAPNESFINAKVARLDNFDALQGVHSPGSVLLVCDEASGIHDNTFIASYGSLSTENARIVLCGNPVRNTGYFYETFHSVASEWKNFTVSCLDSPRVSDSYINEIRSMYGEDSNVWRVRVVGEFPLQDDDTFIPLSLAESAVDRDVEANPDASIVWGVDVARLGSDSSALCKRKGNIVLEPIKTWRKLDLMTLAGALLNEYNETKEGEKPSSVEIDCIGIGAGLLDRLAEQGEMPVRGVNVSESPSLGSSYANLRAELYGKAKEWLEKKNCKLPQDRELINELCTPKYSFNSSGKLKLESKEDMKKRIRSPDKADAFTLTFASSPAIFSGGERLSWNKPIVRNITGVS